MKFDSRALNYLVHIVQNYSMKGFFFLLSVAEQQQEQAYHQSNSLERAGGGEGGGLHNGRESNPRKRFYKSDELVVSYQKLHIERDG